MIKRDGCRLPVRLRRDTLTMIGMASLISASCAPPSEGATVNALSTFDDMGPCPLKPRMSCHSLGGTSLGVACRFWFRTRQRTCTRNKTCGRQTTGLGQLCLCDWRYFLAGFPSATMKTEELDNSSGKLGGNAPWTDVRFIQPRSSALLPGLGHLRRPGGGQLGHERRLLCKFPQPPPAHYHRRC